MKYYILVDMEKVRTLKKVVVLLSGGLDSSTLAYLVAKRKIKSDIYTLTILYGQRHKKELLSAKKISNNIHAVQHKVIELDLTKWGGSALTDKKINIPKNRKLISKTIPITYVPARNTIFLSLALAYSEAIGASEIFIGVNSIDYSGYVDCRPIFINKFQELAKVATVCGVKNKPVKIQTPLLYLNKAEIVKLGQKLGVDWKNTWSCYEGKELACGICDSCRLRLKGFMHSGIKDPIKYKKYKC